jgi:hypothetical protein
VRFGWYLAPLVIAGLVQYYLPAVEALMM